MRKALAELKLYTAALLGVEHPRVEIAELKWKNSQIELDGAEFRALRCAFMIRVNEGVAAHFRRLLVILGEEIKQANGELVTADVLAETRLTKLIENRQAIRELLNDSTILTELVVSVSLKEARTVLLKATALVEKIESMLI